MKNIFIALGIVSLMTMGCGPKKDDTPTVQVDTTNVVNNTNIPGIGGSSNGGGTTPGNNGNEELAITGYAPVNPYLDDEFTISGTGFDPDKTKDTVYFHYTLATINSASATELKVTFPPDIQKDFLAFCYCTDFKVKSHGKSADMSNLLFKRTCTLISVEEADPSNSSVQFGRPDDSIDITGSGFSTIGTTLSIGTTQINNVVIDSGYWCHAYFHLPKDFFGTNYLDETALDSFEVALTNSDGRTSGKHFNFYLSPVMKVNSISTPKGDYSPGETAIVTIQGKNLKPDTKVTISVDGTVINESYLIAQDFPETVVIEVTAAQVGNYNIRLHRATSNIPDANYGICSFTVSN